MDTQFDIEGAIKAGYTPAEINDYLGQQSGFDVAGARKAGYADDEILHHFTPRPEPPKDEGGFMASAKQAVGATIKGAGQAAADFIPGVGGDNALKQYGQEVIDANPTAVRGFGDIIESPWTATKEAVGNAAGSMGGMLGVRALGQGITAASPLAGPAAPVVAAIGQAVSWLGPAAIAALPSFGGIRDKQILDDPANEADAKSKAIAAMGAAAVGAIETAFGPQQWALAAMTKEGRAQTAKMFASTTLGKDIAKGVLKGGAIEGSEELAQNPIEQMASYSDPRTPENIKETLFGGAMGAIGGGVLGGAGGGLLHRKPALVEDVSVTPDPAILSANTADEAIAALGASVSSSLSATQSALDAIKAQAGTMSAVPTGFGQQSELADLIAQEKADLELRRGTIAEQQGAMQALRQESELESTDARVEGARQEQSRQNRLQLLDAIYANPEERTPAMTFMSQLEAEFPNNPNPTPEEKQFMAQRESAYQAFKTEPVEPSLPNETDFGIKEAAPAEPAKPSVDRVRFAQRLLERPGNRLKGDVIRNKYGKVLLKLRPEEVSQVSPQSPVQTPIQSAVLPSAGAQPGQAAAAPIQPQGIQNEQAAQAIQSPAAVQDLPQAAPEAGALPDQLTPGSSAETESDGVAESAAPIVTQQSDNPPTITRIKGGKLAITGFTREDVSESLKTAKIAALVTAGADGKVLVSATDRAGNQVKLTIKQQNAINAALMGAQPKKKKTRVYTGNLRNDVNLIDPRLTDGERKLAEAKANAALDALGEATQSAPKNTEASRPNPETVSQSRQPSEPGVSVVRDGYSDTPRIRQLRQKAAEIESGLPAVADGMTRLWRGNRPGEVGKNPQFTNSLIGIALPFSESYGGPVSYVDVKTSDLSKYENTGTAASGAEFILPDEVAAKAMAVGGSGVTPIQDKAAPSITRIKGGKLRITGYAEDDVTGSLPKAIADAAAITAADGEVSVAMKDGSKMPIRTENAIKKALTGAGTARAPKKRTMTGNLRNDVNLIAPGLYAEVARGGDGEGMDIDLSLVAERLRDEGFMLPTVETGKDSDAVIELIRQDLANGGGTLNERRATEAMEQDKAKKAREEALRPAFELAGQSEAEIRDEEARIAEAKAAEEAEARKAEEQARKEQTDRDKADMQKRLENQPFEFGVGAKEAKKPQRDIFSSPVDAAAHEAATSPTNDKPAPTPGQMEAGNYAKGHIRLHGFDISIENPKGSERVAKDGSWRVPSMPAHYGYIKGTVGADKDHLDVFIGPNPESSTAWVINQVVADSSPAKFDEHKVMIGFDSADEAKKAYLDSFEKGYGARVFGSMTGALTIDELKAKIESGELSRKKFVGPVEGGTDAQREKQGYNEPAGPVAPIANETASSEAVSLSEVLKLAEGKTVSRQVVIAETGQTMTLNNQDAVATIKQINSDIQALEALRICIGG